MQAEDIPAVGGGPEASEIREGMPAAGRILYERFLVEGEFTDPSLGSGFSVFLVKDLQNYCREAVLKLSRFVADDSGAIGPSMIEVCDTLQRLSHPNIEEFLESGRLEDGRPFSLTRPYPAASLSRLIAGGRRLELEEIASLVEQISEGIADAHSKGILHCDLRPSNILVPAGEIGAGSIKIVNFGAAWPIDVRGESLEDVPPGSESLLYAAPELLVKLGHRSPASDVYSLAALVYRTMTGVVPFPGRDRAALLELINAGEPARPTVNRTDISDEAAELVLAGLSFEPVLRPHKVDEFGLRLISLLRPPVGVRKRLIAHESAAMPGSALAEAPEIRAERPRTEKTRQAVPSMHADQRATVSDRVVSWALIILLMAAALSIPIGQTLLRENSQAAAIDTIAGRPVEVAKRHELRYWFEPRGQRDGFAGAKTPGLAFAADSPGYAYVFYEFTAEDGRPNYELGSPAPESPEALKGLEANKPVKADTRSGPAPKWAWIVWTDARNTDLESIRSSVKDGIITSEDDRRRLRHFLERNRNVRLEVKAGDSAGQTVLASTADKIVHRIELREGGS